MALTLLLFRGGSSAGITPPVTIPGSNPGGGGGWSQGRNADFNLAHSPGFEFSKKGKKRKKHPAAPQSIESRVDAALAAPPVANKAPSVTRISDDDLAIMLLFGAVNFPSIKGIDDDDEAIWISLQ